MFDTQMLGKLGAIVRLVAAGFAVVLATAQTGHAQTPPVGSLVQVPFPYSFDKNPGNLNMYEYKRLAPELYAGAKPLVIVLHGCLQTAQQYAIESGWMEVAEKRAMHLVFAEQKSTNLFTGSVGNHPMGCFNWYEPGDIDRGKGEGWSIVQMVNKFHELHPWSIYTPRIYVTGLSAGGAMAAALAAAYPDVFAGVAINAGVPFGCAKNATEAQACMNGALSTKTSADWGTLVRNANPYGETSRKPAVIIFQGTGDTTVTAPRMTELMRQWTNNNRVLETATSTTPLKGYPTNLYATLDPAYAKTAVGMPVKTVSITGMGHGIAVDPASTPILVDQCGAVGSYAINPAKPATAGSPATFFTPARPPTAATQALCSTYYTAEFWNLSK